MKERLQGKYWKKLRRGSVLIMAFLLNAGIPSRLQAGCVLAISPSSRTHGFGASTSSVSVIASNGCSWQVVNTNTWITIISGSNGFNVGTMVYAIPNNLSLNARTGVVLIGDRPFGVTQLGFPGCSYSISPTAQAFDRGPATGVINIGTPSGCPWSVVNSNRWIAITSTTTGTNGPSLTYWVDANPTLLSRTGVLQIAGRTFTVTVGGLAPLKVTPLGANPLTNEMLKVFTDPGATAESGPLALAAGTAHSLALRSDGTVAAWGDNDSGQAAVPGGLGNIVAIAASGRHSLALQRDGSVVAWGDDQFGQSTVPIGLSNVEGIAAGLYHSLALQADGSVAAWGDNSHGQTEALAGSEVTAVAAGHYHSLALHSDGTITAWGAYWDGSTYLPMTVPEGLSNVAAIAAGDSHSLALLRNGTVLSWGNNTAGQTSVPGGLIDAVAIAGGSVHSLALRRDGTVVAWGGNADGQATVPLGLNNVLAIAAGGSNSLALRRDGTVFAWGRNDSGQTNVPGGLGSAMTGGRIVVSGIVDTNSAGVYTLTYTATDSAGNTATATRTVVVVDTSPHLPSADPSWVARYNPEDDSDEVTALAVDRTGNIYVAGASHANTNYTDYVVLKYDPNGQKLWEARYGFGFDQARAMVVDGAGNVYVTGESGGQYHYDTVKFDPDGHQLWSARYDGPAALDDRATALAVDGAGQVYVTGRSQNSSRNYDYATIKYDTNGNQLWVARYNGPYNSDDRAVAVGVDASGNVYVTGTSINVGTGDDYATVKYDADGHQLWVVQYNGPDNFGDDHATAMAVDSGGNVYVTGTSWDFSTVNDYATVKYNTYGNQLWVARYDGPGNSDDRPAALSIDSEGQVYVTGFSTGQGTGADYATIKYGADGRELWVARYNGLGNSDDRAAALAVDGAGKVYVTGASGAAYATVSYDAGGNQCWVGRYRGPGTNPDSAVALGLDSSGNVYVTGENGGFLPFIYRSNTFATLKYTNSVPEGAPIISLGPETQVALPGSTVSFHVEASGAAPLSYQWRFNGLDIPSATNATLLLPSFQTDQVGDYSVVVTNEIGMAVSIEARLTAGAPPAMVAAAWVATYHTRGGWRDRGWAQAMALDGAGHVYVTGTSGTARYGANGNRFWEAGGYGSAIAVDSAGQACVTGTSPDAGYATIKYDIYGNQLWVAGYQGAESLTANALVLDTANNVYVAGSLTGASADWVTVKYDPNGNQLWAARYDGPNHGDDVAKALAVDSAGNVYVTGYSYGAGSDSDFLTIKYDASGNQIWMARYNGPGNSDDFARLVALDSAGHVYVTGSSVGSRGDFDYATVKYDTNGNQLWVARYDGTGHAEDKARGLAVDSDGNAYVTGYSTGSGTGYDYATVKYGPDGQQLWAARYNGPENGSDQAVALALDSAGFVYITGRSATVKYAPNGTRLWVARYGFDEVAAGLAVDNSGAVYVSGDSYQGNTQGDHTTIQYVQTGINGCPALTLLPQNQAVPPGANVTFTAQASGLMPLSFQWTCNGTNIAGATNATLGLTNVQVAQAGDYTILVSNAIAEVSSPVAQLKVLVPCPVTTPLLSLRWQLNPAAALLEWPTDALCYHLEMAKSLRAPNWRSIPISAVTNGVNRVTMDQAGGNRFFRLRKE